jgi:Tfp pilus assembly protein PilN
VLAHRGRVLWAGTATFTGFDQAVATIGRLAADVPRKPRNTRIVLARDVVQLRTLLPAPPLSARAARRYVALEATRLFRRNGSPLVTDARLVWIKRNERALCAGAAAEPLVSALVRGCEEAGLTLDAIGPAAEVLPWAVERRDCEELIFTNGAGSECISLSPAGPWRSCLVSGTSAVASPDWVPGLAALGEQAPAFAAAYGATVRAPALDLLPAETRAARLRLAWKHVRWTAAIAAALWLAAGLMHATRLQVAARMADRELRMMGPAVDSALALRRELTAARAALATIRRAEATRSQHLVLLSDLTRALGDSVVVAALELSADSTLRLVGYAAQAPRVLAALERLGWLRNVRFEVPTMREHVGPGAEELDRFTIAARVVRTP